MSKSILVFGGNGFVGSSICKYALSQGLKVVAVSRSGRPRIPEAWQSEVEYIQGDAMSPQTYASILPSVSGVVHSIGVLFESKIPFLRSSEYQGSYRHMNRDTAMTIVQEIKGKNIPFAYVSSERGIFFSPGYIETKREVEDYLARNKEYLPYSIIRPGFMYSNDNSKLKGIATAVDLLNFPDFAYKKVGLEWIRNNLVPAKSLDVNVVAKVVVKSLFEPELRFGTFNVEDIERVAQKYRD